MPELTFQIEGVAPVPYAAVPMLALKLRIENSPPEQTVHSLALRCQVQIEPAKRRYDENEKAKLHDLFGEPERWGRTVRPMLWMNTTLAVPSFSEKVVAELQLPCSFDFNVASTKYFHALQSGDVPICVLFSGTVFYSEGEGPLQVAQIPWDREVNFRLPAQTWKQLMDLYYPASAWLCLSRDAFDRLYQYKVRHGIATWEQVLARLIPTEEVGAATREEVQA